ncbi:MAG: hypothetical protein JXB15_12490 [Anaerolineales bacterium]|nr:hypothetical protein [Anaerolineales bacterium]
MTISQLAQKDFERAVSKGFWRKVLSILTRKDTQLLPFDEIRKRLPIRGQHYIGFRQVPIDKICGSMGRYHDFDRAFLPLQRRTRDRWISVDLAHYEAVPLPPVELYQIGDIYFVKDGNHRVSVARERGQDYVDAYVIEIDTPIKLTSDLQLSELDLKQAYADFLLNTRLNEFYPEAEIELSRPDFYPEVLRHIDLHRWYLGERRSKEIPYEEAVVSWYDQIYQPLVVMIREHGVLKDFSSHTEADLCLWLMEYQGYLRRAYNQMGEDDSDDMDAETTAARQLLGDYPLPAVKKLISLVNRAHWLDDIILEQERVEFLELTRLDQLRPGSQIIPTLPGQCNRIREHIAVHRWYLGEQRQAETPYDEAVASWYDRIYLPLIEIIREQGILEKFPGRTETDLYLWIITHRWYLQQAYEAEIPLEEAAEKFTEDFSGPGSKKGKKAKSKAAGDE